MTYLVISDIHGKIENLKKILKNESFDRLIVLGDLLSYHSFFDNEEEIIKIISTYKNILTLIKGNCDRFINYESYNLSPIDIITFHVNNHLITFTHGHLYNETSLPEYHGNIFISGHTHVPIIKEEKNMIFVNPGSIGIPRNGSSASYLIIEDNKLILKTLDKKIIKEMNI